MNKNIGFVGLGVMGSHMASHLINNENQIHIIQRSSKNTKKFINKFKFSQRITIHQELNSLSRNCDVIISCVGNDTDLKNIFLSKQCILKNIKPNTIIIDHTTASPKISKIIYKKCLSKNAHFFDAPLSGGEIGAKNGSLSIMVGGKKSEFNNLKSIIGCYSKSLIYMGNIGSGQLAKMANQICVASIIQGLAEALNFAKKKKLNIDDLINVIKNGAAQSWQLENRSQTMWKNDFSFGFMNKLMLKDLTLILNEIKNSNIKLPMTKKIRNYYIDLIKQGFEREDTSNLIRLLK